MGMQKLLSGILRYRVTFKNEMVKQFQRIKDDPKPSAIVFTCMDSRMLPSRFCQAQIGDMFIVRNAGNLVPHYKHYGYEHITTEPAALELGCVINNIKHVIVIGHSDCKAMNTLWSLKDEVESQEGSPLQLWMKRHAKSSLKKFGPILGGKRGPLVFQAETPQHTFEAFIDVENKFNITDKLSQVNCLQQVQNIASHPFLHEKLSSEQVRIHAMWFDIYTGEVYLFSRKNKKFIRIDEETIYKIFYRDRTIIDEVDLRDKDA
ncbi:beta carbonic anhydrase 1-like [Lineus longissimus]|uniref:beta carbonic anhydrase 1-like n=1 Tax=Lineus longissimus TaxID=88925 RepID=UPI002B4C7750